jgi:plastocyanin
VFLAACTPGATSVPSGGGDGSTTTTVDVNLTAHPATSTPAGQGGGFAPAVTRVAVGTFIRFTNSDSFAHTATDIQGARSFPASSPLGASALQRFGDRLSQGWSSGTLQAGASAQPLLADQAGTYLYGCFFHYGSPMRGVIVVH